MFSPRAKKPIRTYARQRKPQPSLHDDKPAAKRRRVIATPPPASLSTSPESIKTNKTPYPYSTSPESSSSPIRTTSSSKDDAPIFSDTARESTQPSSPLRLSSSPPLLGSSPPVTTRMRRPMFTFMKRSAISHPPTVKIPLVETRTTHNVLLSSIQPPRKKQKMVQMQLDLVAELRKKCATCGMEYIPSNAEDASTHKKFHAQNVGGVDFTKAFVERIKPNQVWESGDGGFIAAVSRKDTLAIRNKASEVLKVVNTELAAITVTDEALWSQIRGKECLSEKGMGMGGGRGDCDRFKVYLYIRGTKCVGACLAERIQEAFAVVDQEDVPRQKDTGPAAIPVPVPGDSQQGSSISISRTSSPAMLGISRIWTSKLERKKGIASNLLDVARGDFLYGMRIEKEMVAFSQPTASGGELAKGWFARRAGWHVYIDED